MRQSRSGTSGPDVAPPTPEARAPRRAAAALLLVGGLLEVLQYSGVFGGLYSALPHVPVDVFFTIPRLAEAAGLLLLGLSMRRRARIALVIASVWNLAAGVIATAHDLSREEGSGLSSPLFSLVLLGFAAVIVAAVVVFSDTAEPRRARSVLLLPALGLLVILSSQFLPLGPVPWLTESFVFLPGIGFAVAGFLLLRSAARTGSRAAA